MGWALPAIAIVGSLVGPGFAAGRARNRLECGGSDGIFLGETRGRTLPGSVIAARPAVRPCLAIDGMRHLGVLGIDETDRSEVLRPSPDPRLQTTGATDPGQRTGRTIRELVRQPLVLV